MVELLRFRLRVVWHVFFGHGEGPFHPYWEVEPRDLVTHGFEMCAKCRQIASWTRRTLRRSAGKPDA